MNNINTIPHGISQTPTTSPSLRDGDSEETRTPREIDFSKWFGEHGSESIPSEERASEDRFILMIKAIWTPKDFLLGKRGDSREDDSELSRISDREWGLVEPYFNFIQMRIRMEDPLFQQRP